MAAAANPTAAVNHSAHRNQKIQITVEPPPKTLPILQLPHPVLLVVVELALFLSQAFPFTF
jgi:hypothetical protein